MFGNNTNNTSSTFEAMNNLNLEQIQPKSKITKVVIWYKKKNGLFKGLEIFGEDDTKLYTPS